MSREKEEYLFQGPFSLVSCTRLLFMEHFFSFIISRVEKNLSLHVLLFYFYTSVGIVAVVVGVCERLFRKKKCMTRTFHTRLGMAKLGPENNTWAKTYSGWVDGLRREGRRLSRPWDFFFLSLFIIYFRLIRPFLFFLRFLIFIFLIIFPFIIHTLSSFISFLTTDSLLLWHTIIYTHNYVSSNTSDIQRISANPNTI